MHSGWSQKSIPPFEILLLFYLFYPRDISHSTKNWELTISTLGLALKKHILTSSSVTNSSDSSQKILSTSQETKADLPVRHWSFKSLGHLKTMAWSLDRPHSTICLLQRVPIFPTREWRALPACRSASQLPLTARRDADLAGKTQPQHLHSQGKPQSNHE